LERGPRKLHAHLRRRGRIRRGPRSRVKLHLRDGELHGTRLLSEAAAREMREINVPGKRYDLGLGWMRPAAQREAHPPFVQHLGGGGGFYNVIRLYPTREVGIAVMGNTTKYDIDRVAALALSA
jgi:CubicO group peptidase (beta-lactamase class C family)